MPFAFIILLTIGLMGFQADWAYGHGGEDHGETTSQQPTALGLGNGAVGDLYEAVIVLADTGLTWIYLSDVKTNAPITDATIEVEATPSPGWTLKGESTSSVGVYRFERALPLDAAVDLTLTVTGANGSDLILIHVPARTHQETVAVVAELTPRRFLVPGLIVLAVGWGGWLLLRRKRAKTPLAVMSGLLVVMTAGLSHPHGGEDHSAAPKEPLGNVATTNRGVSLPKASQFLLDVRTFPAEQREVTQTIRLVGHVIPDPAFHARIHPQVASRIVFDPAFPPPRSGQKVKRGQTLAVLDPVLSNVEKTGQRLSLFKGEQREAFMGRELVLAPMDGQLTDVHIIPGDIAVEADVLAEIIDPDHLWVEAILYDLSMAEQITAATASSRQIPGQKFSLTLMGVSPKVNPEDQGLHLQFAFEKSGSWVKPGMPMDVYAHTGAALFVVAIPRQAILEQGGIPRVWVKTAPEEFVGRSVRIGRKTAEWVEILEGIQPGDKVVVQGHNQLNAIR